MLTKARLSHITLGSVRLTKRVLLLKPKIYTPWYYIYDYIFYNVYYYICSYIYMYIYSYT